MGKLKAANLVLVVLALNEKETIAMMLDGLCKRRVNQVIVLAYISLIICVILCFVNSRITISY